MGPIDISVSAGRIRFSPSDLSGRLLNINLVIIQPLQIILFI